MPRTSRSKHKRHRQKKENKGSGQTTVNKPNSENGKSKSTPKFTSEQLLNKAEECLDSFDVTTANLFIERALQQSSDSGVVLERAGSMLLEAEQPDAALAVFNRAANLDDVTHLTFLYLGQLCQGLEAVQHYRKGIEILQKHTPDEGNSNDAAVSKAFCSIAELYMTDLCFEEDAQTQCEAAISSALSASPGSTEALQLRASYALTCSDKQGAKEWLGKAVNPWLPGLNRQKSDEGASAQTDAEFPEFDIRIKIAQLAIELEQYELASDVLEQLLDEDDQMIQVWYLLGWLNHIQELWANAAHYLTQALQLEDKADTDDKKLLEHARQLLSEVKSAEVEEEEKMNPDEVAEHIVQMSDEEEEMET